MRVLILMVITCVICHVETPLVFGDAGHGVNVERLADAIWRAEGGHKTKHPYGILKRYKTTTPRQACINTIKSGLKRYASYKGKDDFIVFLSKTYCPLNDPRDKTGLNKNWVKNVKFYYNNPKEGKK